MINGSRLFGELVVNRGRWVFHLIGLGYGAVSVKVVDESGVAERSWHRFDCFDDAMEFVQWFGNGG